MTFPHSLSISSQFPHFPSISSSFPHSLSTSSQRGCNAATIPAALNPDSLFNPDNPDKPDNPDNPYYPDNPYNPDNPAQANDSPYGPVNATMLSAVAAKDNTSATVEVEKE